MSMGTLVLLPTALPLVLWLSYQVEYYQWKLEQKYARTFGYRVGYKCISFNTTEAP